MSAPPSAERPATSRHRSSLLSRFDPSWTPRDEDLVDHDERDADRDGAA